MLIRNLILTLTVLAAVQTALAQATEIDKSKANAEQLRKDAVELLREASVEVGSLRSLENRIGFASEMAGLMWFHDSKQATVMYQSVITDFKQLLADTDNQLNAMNLTPDESLSPGGPFGGGGESDKARLTQKFYKAMGVRQQIAMSLAEHDPALAYDFFYETLSIITNPALRKSLEDRGGFFESQLLQRISEKDPAKAYEMGRKSLGRGVAWTHVELLKKIYEKDPDKGAAFASEIVGKFKTDKVSSGNFYNLGSFLKMGAENAEAIKKEKGKKAMFTEQNLRDLAEIFAQELLDGKTEAGSEYVRSVPLYLEVIEKYAPARAVQLRSKFAGSSKTPKIAVREDEVLLAPPLGKESVAELETRQDADQAENDQAQITENVKKLGSKELPKEEREKIVARSRKIIGGLGSRQEKLMALSMLGSQVFRLGDRELAAEIMKDAQTLVSPAPKHYRDYMEVWILASAYSETDPEKAFPVLEDAILRLNETLAAFIKVGEFIDVSGEIIDDGEVQLSAMGGSMVNEMMRGLGIANSTVRHLAVADFAKTKALTNRFDRTEVRILAKMLVLRAVLGDERSYLETKDKIEDMEIRTDSPN